MILNFAANVEYMSRRAMLQTRNMSKCLRPTCFILRVALIIKTMGMYDSVIVRCPKCEAEHEFQSKSGDCFLNVFTLTYPALLLGSVIKCYYYEQER